MSRKAVIQRSLNTLMMVSLVLVGLVFVTNTTGYGLLLGPIAWVIAVGVFRHFRWAYFAAAVWALACYQLAKEGLEFELLKRAVMVLSIPLVVLAIYLHETLGRRRAASEHTQ
ncbi:hypothetical protein [Marinimicrobium sp. C2-29]|uniref:hypothetical protein n=1 Tax=Marinimicrobium sp. C2-29 TaxID=3139825 RepID=UPI003139EAE2